MLITFKEFQNDQSCKTFSWTTAYEINFQSVFSITEIRLKSGWKTKHKIVFLNK